MGASKPWEDAMEAITGGRKMDARPMLDYFDPLKKWLKHENRKNEEYVGWITSDEVSCIKMESKPTTTTQPPAPNSSDEDIPQTSTLPPPPPQDPCHNKTNESPQTPSSSTTKDVLSKSTRVHNGNISNVLFIISGFNAIIMSYLSLSYQYAFQG